MRRTAAASSLLLSILLLAQCQKRDVAPALPPETSSGANKAGCLVNEQVLVPRDIWGHSGTNLAFRLGATAATSAFSLGISDEQNNQSPLVSITADSLLLEEGRSYPFSGAKAGKGIVLGECLGTGGSYTTTAPGSGTLTITRLDRNANILSGRFEFVATNRQTGAQVRVTQGRFDYKVD